MPTIRQVLTHKGSEVVAVAPDVTVFDAIKRMADLNIGSLLVVDEGRLVGIFTERHYARNVILKGRSSPLTPVAEVMDRSVVCTHPDHQVEEAMAVMSTNRVRHLPVMAAGKLIGLVSIGDLVGSIIRDREFVIEQLEHYIHS